VLSLATNIHVYSPAAFLSYHVIGHVEEHLVKFRQEGCKGVLVLLSTYGGEVTFPEAFISKLRGMGFEKVHTFVLDAAFSAGTLLALLSDKIVGFSSSHLGRWTRSSSWPRRRGWCTWWGRCRLRGSSKSCYLSSRAIRGWGRRVWRGSMRLRICTCTRRPSRA
jgi:hypothetical protein